MDSFVNFQTGILEPTFERNTIEYKDLDLLFGYPNDDFSVFSNFFECVLPLDELPTETCITVSVCIPVCQSASCVWLFEQVLFTLWLAI
jgi:hypothetical protein